MAYLRKTKNNSVFCIYYKVSYRIINCLLLRSYIASVSAYLGLFMFCIYSFAGQDRNNEFMSSLADASVNKTLVTSAEVMIFFMILLFYMIIFGTHILFSLLGTKKENFLLALHPFFICRTYKSHRIFKYLHRFLVGNFLSGKVQEGSLMAYILMCSGLLCVFFFFRSNDFNIHLSFLFLSIPFIVAIVALIHFLAILSRANNNRNKNKNIFFAIYIRHALLGTIVLSFLISFAAIIYNIKSIYLAQTCALFLICIPLMIGISLVFQTAICLLFTVILVRHGCPIVLGKPAESGTRTESER